MNLISKRTFFLTFFSLFWALFLTRGGFAQTSSLKIQDFQMYKNIEQGQTTLFYHTIFKPSQIPPSTFLTPLYEPFSLGENMAQQKIHEAAARHSVKKAWSQIRGFVRNSAQLYLIGELEAASSSPL